MNREALEKYRKEVQEIREAGLFKSEAAITSPLGDHV